MVTAAEIRDEESLKAWLEGRPAAVAVLAARVVLRVAPIALRFPVGHERDQDATTFPILRSVLICGIASKRPTPQLGVMAASASRLAVAGAASALRSAIGTDDTYDDPSAILSNVATDLVITSATAVASVASRATPIAPIAATGTFARLAARFQTWEEVREDARALESEDDLLQRPLWSIPAPDWFREADAAMRALWQADPAYAFWLRWWDGVLSGHQIDWTLQEKVATLIPDEVWQQGAEAVAAEIARIEEQLRLLREVERLTEQLASARSEIAALSRRGHNNPPELVEPVAEIERQASEISKALEEAAQELKSDVPRPSVLRRVGRALLNATAKLLIYCATLGDVALRSTAVAAGTAAGPILVAKLTGHWQEVQSLAKALLAIARSLGGG